MYVNLSVNLNKIALIRNSRSGTYPNVHYFAEQCLFAGANGITVHPRPDMRHIRPDDVLQLSELIVEQRRQGLKIEFNIEGNPFSQRQTNNVNGEQLIYPGLLELVKLARPQQVTLVPDAIGQLTSDSGFNLKEEFLKLKPIVSELQNLSCKVSLFIEPTIRQIEWAKKLNADAIELYTGPYAQQHQQQGGTYKTLLTQYRNSSKYANEMGLTVNAGHDLNIHNIKQFSEAVPLLSEVSIGHALVVEALDVGLKTAIQKYLSILQADKSEHL